MVRNEILSAVKKYFAQLKVEVELGSKKNLLDTNVYAETTIARILNLLYDLELENANKGTASFPAIDLVDVENRVAIQVSSSNTSKKVKDTLKGFMKHGMYEKFDTLYCFVLGEKANLQGTGFDQIVGNYLSFDKNQHIIDLDTLFDWAVNSPSIRKQKQLLGILEEEMSSDAVSSRQSKILNKSNKEEKKDTVYLNLVGLQLPESIFSASLDFDTKSVIERAKEYEWDINYKNLKNPNYVAMLAHKISVDKDNRCKDWYVWNNRLFTFRNLHIDRNLHSVIDIGTIEEESCEDFFEIDINYTNTFKHLVLCLLKEELPKIGIEQFSYNNLFRFQTNRITPKEEKRDWKRAKRATKTVVKEIRSKDGIITCFRHLSMETSIVQFGGKWYMSISPTYVVSSAQNIYKTHPFQQKIVKQQKNLEFNKSVFYLFLLFEYVLTNCDDFNFIKFNSLDFFEVPAITIQQ
ncbi:MAG: SMEK domain-containing protein [Aureispira sp.]